MTTALTTLTKAPVTSEPVSGNKDINQNHGNYSGAKLGNISKEAKISNALLIQVSITDLIMAKFCAVSIDLN